MERRWISQGFIGSKGNPRFDQHLDHYRAFFKENGIRFEEYEELNAVCFEYYVNKEEMLAVNEFADQLWRKGL